MTDEPYACSRCGKVHTDARLRCQRCNESFKCPSTIVRFETIGGGEQVVHMIRRYDDPTSDAYERVPCGPVVDYPRERETIERAVDGLMGSKLTPKEGR